MAGSEADAMGEVLRSRLRQALKLRDSVVIAACRSALAAIQNAEAVAGAADDLRAGAIEASPVGVGVGDLPRRMLGAVEIRAIVEREISECRAGAVSVTLDDPDRAAFLIRQAEVLQSVLGEYGARPGGPRLSRAY